MCLKPRATLSPAILPTVLGCAVAHEAGVGAHLLAPCAAEQVAQRQAGALAGDVPQRDVDAGVRVDHRPVAAEDVEGLGGLAMQRVDVGRVLAEEPRAHVGLERRLGGRDDGVAEALAPAGDAGIRLHLHQQMVHGGKPQAGELLLGRPHVEGDADVVGVNGRDLHGCSSRAAGTVRRRRPRSIAPPRRVQAEPRDVTAPDASIASHERSSPHTGFSTPPRAALTWARRRIIAPVHRTPAEETGSFHKNGPAPKEQPPRNLSGKRTAGRWHSGKQPAQRRLTEGVRRQIPPKSLRSRDRGGLNSRRPVRDASSMGLGMR